MTHRKELYVPLMEGCIQTPTAEVSVTVTSVGQVVKSHVSLPVNLS